MKLTLVFAAILAVAVAVPQSGKDAQITAYSNDVGLDGYNFAFQTSDGISRNEQGTLKNPGTENEAIEVRGTYTYKGVDGKDYTVNFVANENGYQPQVSARK
ncbi:endocuticle structural glycoprotein SgAbd-5-like [Periplaneta americana]|uniref:endocuticle structural glycoprotein SgAbd-5-like n=1 Tax=Periplaneta americana TaxID=6978 RepID=UPI0037E7AE3F